jgi:hypothetical protein
MKLFLSFVFMMLFPFMVFAEDAPVVVPNQEFLGFLIQSIGGFSGASTLVAVGLVVQILMKFIGTPWADLLFGAASGKWKLLIVAVLSLAGGVLGLMTAGGLTLGAALVHSATLTAVMVLFNQVYKQFILKE